MQFGKVMRHFVASLGWMVMGLAQAGESTQTIEFYTYYDYPPLVTEPDKGLHYDLAEYLTRHSNGRYEFKAILLPRKRLDAAIEGKWPGVVAWASPPFFGDLTESKYAWSVGYQTDSDLLISHITRPIKLGDLATQRGLRFGGTLGHKYVLFDPLFESGALVRDDTRSLSNNLRMLMNHRVDLTIISASSLDYFRSVMLDFSASVYVEPKPLKVFDRRMFVAKDQLELFRFINSTAATMRTDKEWKEIQATYRAP